MKPSQIIKQIDKLYGTGESMYIFGPPGVGKSRIVEQAAEIIAKRVKGFQIEILHANVHDPSDVKFPVVDHKKKTVEFVNSLFPKDPNWKGIFFLDELDKCAPMLQAAFLQPVLEGRVGSVPLPKGMMFIGAGNQIEDGAGSRNIISALQARFCGVRFDVDEKEWIDWAKKNGIDYRIINFIESRGDILHGKREPESWGWPNPRSWEKVSRVGLGSEEVAAGFVGKGAARDFFAFLSTVTPDYETLVSNPDGISIPTEPGPINSMVSLFESRIKEEKDEKKILSIAKITDRLSPEYKIMAFRKIYKANKSVIESPFGIEFTYRLKELYGEFHKKKEAK